MAKIKLNVADPKKGKCKQFELEENVSESLIGLKIGSQFSVEVEGLEGYKFEITGGSDKSGFPMRKGISSTGRKKIIMGEGIGFRGKDRWKKSQKNIKKKKTVCGEVVSEKTVQLNVRVVQEGKTPIFEEAKPEEAPKAEEKAEAPKEEVKEEPKAEEPAKEEPKAEDTKKEE